jgi:hypothetical protein
MADHKTLSQQMTAINAQIDILRQFNRKVGRLEQSGFCRRFDTEIPNVIAKFEDVTFEKTGDTTFNIVGRIDSWLEDFNQDEIDAFVLTFRLFTQDNDRISLHRLSKIYASGWMAGGNARECFEDARKDFNNYLDSAATIMFGENAISIRSIADIVIYGGLAHTNAQKSAVFENWARSGMMGFIWAEFFAYARHAIEILRYLRSLNTGVLEHAEKYGFTAGEPSSPDLS